MKTGFDINVTDIGDAINNALNLIDHWTALEKTGQAPYIWFRGVNDCGHKLDCGAYWREKLDGYTESAPLMDFSQRGGRFPDGDEIGPVNSWGTYYLAQHYGIPTRLLDWTESFVSALFFATDGIKDSSEACVWALNPEAFNELSVGYQGIVSPENNREIDIWLPEGIKTRQEEPSTKGNSHIYDNERTLAIYPKHHNTRIRSQSGFFTIHGRDKTSIDDFILNSGKPTEGLIARLCFRGVDALKLRRQVGEIGIVRSLIYPDLDNFTKELKEFYKWK
jgi:hypothetical protein